MGMIPFNPDHEMTLNIPVVGGGGVGQSRGVDTDGGLE